MVPILKSLLVVALLVCSLGSVSRAQTVQRLTHQPPNGDALEFQLTDGTVMVQADGESDWYKLTPDITGSYLNGTWTKLASLPAGYAPDAFASAVLADGRLLIEGGEYDEGVFAFTNQGEIYDPDTNTWTEVAPPAGWQWIGDAPSAVLPNGKFLLGSKFDTRLAVLDPATLQWTAVPSTGKSDFDAEEGWTLLSDGTVVTVDVKNNPNSEKYIPSKREWVTAGSTIANLQGPPSITKITCCGGLVYYPPGEVGPAILRPDGTVFATGATHSGASAGHTAIYTPALHSTGAGTWTAGPDFPNRDQAGDSFAVLLPNGDPLVEGDSGTSYEFNGTSLTPGPSTFGALMMLPTGQVLVGGSPTEVYNPTGTYSPAWAPSITSFPATVVRGSTYTISGRQFNGLSQAAAFGDEYETATNYPLVRITNQSTGHVFYAKTHDHSTMGVATGNAIVSTNFDVPAGMETGSSTLVVVANGIPSPAVAITVN
ncbi:MAG TPA: kelch repeat-containing protein [Terriglobia bacterium]|nr:kelch repeat-containing protein [Terriglobia bacterium]